MTLVNGFLIQNIFFLFELNFPSRYNFIKINKIVRQEKCNNEEVSLITNQLI